MPAAAGRGARKKPGTYHQTNHYTWTDGRTEVRDFPALIRDGRLVWQGEHALLGQAERTGRLDRRTLIDEEKVSDDRERLGTYVNR